ncbi:Membrane protein, partial [Phytophthora palmivora]
MDRTLLTSQSSDIGNILFDDLHWLGDFLVIDLTRLKVRQQHSISLFCFPGNWAIDPYHSLACQLIADPWNASDRVFSQIVDGKNEARIATHIFRVLKSLYNDDSATRMTPGLRSHSARRLGGTSAS